MEKMTLSSLAKKLNVSHQALYNRIKRGTLNASKVDGTWYIDATECERVLQGFETVSNDSQPESNGVEVPLEGDLADEPCDTCERRTAECERWQEKHQMVVEQNEYLKKRIEWLESQIERQTILLATEQAQRMKALPRPFGWFGRVFRRD
jgi:DNA-binding Lrp family transcriptional regulator